MEASNKKTKIQSIGLWKKLKKKRNFSLVVWLIGFVIVWEILAFYVQIAFRTPENYLPHIYDVIISIFTVKNGGDWGFGLVLESAGITISRALLGFGIGIVLGYVLALLMDLIGAVEKIAFPFLMIIQMIPILGLAPIIFAMTNNVDVTRITIAAILTFYPISTNVLAGFKAVESEKRDLMKICAANKFTVYYKTMIPSAMPYFFTGLKIAAPLAITAAILVDTLQGGTSLGCLLSQSLKGGMSRYIFWQIVFLSAFIGVGSSGLMGLIERIVCPYKYKSNGKLKKLIQKIIDLFKKKECVVMENETTQSSEE